MMGKQAPSFAPPWAVLVWVDATNVYAEFRSSSGDAPLIVKYPKTEGGFAKTLHFAEARFKDTRPKGGYYQMPSDPPKVKKAKKEPAGTEASRAEAHAILKKMGMIK